MSFEIKGSREVSIPEVKRILEKRMDEGDVSDVVMRTYEYVRRFTKCDEEKIEELRSFLEERGFNEKTIAMVLSICPTTIEELRSLFVFEDKTYDTDVLNEIVETIKKYIISEK
ncbi:MAG TPA: RNA polymerase Rpb4 [Desulfurococcaceae archaeon]|nr:RNA polymerase Rpb4 [Desulfurococcaceae archaeon]